MIKLIRKSAKQLLDRNKDAIILIKGPHTMNRIHSYWYYHYRAIIKKEIEKNT